jgi:hypothetical protein
LIQKVRFTQRRIPQKRLFIAVLGDKKSFKSAEIQSIFPRDRAISRHSSHHISGWLAHETAFDRLSWEQVNVPLKPLLLPVVQHPNGRARASRFFLKNNV